MSEIHLDHSVLRGLQDVLEDDYPKLLDIFLADSEERLRQLQRATDLSELGMAAHSFCGSSSNMGARRLAGLCRQLEEQLQRAPTADVKPLLGSIEQEVQTVHRLYSIERQRFDS